MKTVSLSGSPREGVGKKDAKLQRLEGLIPGVLYGEGKNVHFTVKEIDLEKIVNSPDVYFLDIDIAGQNYQTIIQELQFHPVTDRVLHFDLMRVFDDKLLKMRLPVHLVGASIGVRNGGVLRHIRHRVSILALPGDIPDYIEIDITRLRIGTQITIGDLNFPKLNFLADDGAVVCAVRTARNIIEEVEEEEEEGEEGEEGAAAEGEEGAEKKEGEGKPAEGGDKPAEGGDQPADK